MKFDKNGKIISQKIKYEIKHEEVINDLIKEIEREKKEIEEEDV